MPNNAEGITVTIEVGEKKMDEQISQQMAQQLHNSNRRLDDVAERFQTTMAFTEARSNQQWQTGSTMLFPLTQNIIEQDDMATQAMRKKTAENANPSTQGKND